MKAFKYVNTIQLILELKKRFKILILSFFLLLDFITLYHNIEQNLHIIWSCGIVGYHVSPTYKGLRFKPR